MSTQKLFLDSPIFGNSRLSSAGVRLSSQTTVARPSQFIDMMVCSESTKRPVVSSDRYVQARRSLIDRNHATQKTAAAHVPAQPEARQYEPLVAPRSTIQHKTSPEKQAKLPASGRKTKTTKQVSWSQRLLVVAAVVMVIGGGYVVVDGYYTNRTVVAQATKLAHVAAEHKTDETASQQSATSDDGSTAAGAKLANASAVSAVPADHPKFIDIPKLRIHTKVTAKGLDKTGAVSVPSNTNQVGWYTNSASPGKSGAAFMMGHVSGYTNRGGIFYNLKALEAGDTITITMGDNRTFTYVVVSKETTTKDAVDMTKALTPIRLDKPGLNLMTCSGTYNGREQTYDQRLIVYASLQ